LGLLDVSLVEVVEDVVEPMVSEPFFFLLLCFFFVVVVLLVSFVPIWLFDEFCAKSAAQGNNESPRAAIMIFFIFGVSPYSY
jgi:hypothetical protein